MSWWQRWKEIVRFWRSRTAGVVGDSETTGSLPSRRSNSVSGAGPAWLDHPPPYPLEELQQLFPRLLAELIRFAYQRGYSLRLGEAFRPPETAAVYAKKGVGIARSLHTERLAIDLLLHVDGVYQTDSATYEPLGQYWESLSTPGVTCCWGGHFKDAKGKPKPDGGHFSITYGGRK